MELAEYFFLEHPANPEWWYRHSHSFSMCKALQPRPSYRANQAQDQKWSRDTTAGLVKRTLTWAQFEFSHHRVTPMVCIASCSVAINDLVTCQNIPFPCSSQIQSYPVHVVFMSLSLCLLFSNTTLETVQHELPLERWCLISAMRVLLLVMMDLTWETCPESLAEFRVCCHQWNRSISIHNLRPGEMHES